MTRADDETARHRLRASSATDSQSGEAAGKVLRLIQVTSQMANTLSDVQAAAEERDARIMESNRRVARAVRWMSAIGLGLAALICVGLYKGYGLGKIVNDGRKANEAARDANLAAIASQRRQATALERMLRAATTSTLAVQEAELAEDEADAHPEPRARREGRRKAAQARRKAVDLTSAAQREVESL